MWCAGALSHASVIFSRGSLTSSPCRCGASGSCPIWQSPTDSKQAEEEKGGKKCLEMPRERIKMRKIENAAARQATFSKRQRGLFKKALELAVLCDVDVGVIVFCSKGKLYHFSSNSMEDIIKKYLMDPDNELDNSDQTSPQTQLENAKYQSLENETVETTLEPRHFKGEDIEELTMGELVQLEEALGKGLRRVLNRKGEKLMEENKLLRQQVMELTKDRELKALPDPVTFSHEGTESSVSVATALNSEKNKDLADSSGASLKLWHGHN